MICNCVTIINGIEGRYTIISSLHKNTIKESLYEQSF